MYSIPHPHALTTPVPPAHIPTLIHKRGRTCTSSSYYTHLLLYGVRGQGLTKLLSSQFTINVGLLL